MYTKEIILQEIVESGRKDISNIYTLPLSENHKDIPIEWIFLSKEKNPQSIIETLWVDIKKTMPTVYYELIKRTVQIVIAKDEKYKSILLYIFKKDNELFFRAGNPKLTQEPNLFENIPKEIKKIYNIHDGFIDFISEDHGFLPYEEIVNFNKNKKSNFLTIASFGSNWLGFDIETKEVKPYIVWTSDEEIEVVKDLTAALDEWIADDLANFDEI